MPFKNLNSPKSVFRTAAWLSLALLLSSCSNTQNTQQTNPVIHTDHSVSRAQSIGNLINFGEKNLTNLQKKYHQIHNHEAPKGTVLNIIQLGDSHTASDTFTAPLRDLMAQEIGLAGIGWVSPMAVNGQAHRMVSYSQDGWNLTNSRTQQHPDFPMGGLIATPTKDNAKLTINTRRPTSGISELQLLIKPNTGTLTLTDANHQSLPLLTQFSSPSSSGWHTVDIQAKLPITITAEQANAASLGGIWIKQKQTSGVMISPIGSNGAQQSIWQRWQNNWMHDLANQKVDLFIIAYGTNEAFSPNMDSNQVRNQLKQGIQQLRQQNPKASILILGAPDAVDKRQLNNHICGQPANLTAIKNIQREVAQQEKTLYWDWQQAMGGDCKMQNWRDQGLAAKDLVHFTKDGYNQNAALFWEDLKSTLNPR